jgi:hypothetical protein
MGLVAGLAACASAADPGAMTLAAPPAATATPFPVAFQHAMCVRSVTGGESTNALWVSKVDNGGFQTALSSSLAQAGLGAVADACKYRIDANLLGLSQPVAGLDMTVTSHVNYKVYDSSGAPIVLATIDAPYTAKFGDSLIAANRLQKANEGSIRVSIENFFDKLRATDVK